MLGLGCIVFISVLHLEHFLSPVIAVPFLGKNPDEIDETLNSTFNGNVSTENETRCVNNFSTSCVCMY